ncbi:flagellar biosynthetic protein FliO [Mixta theicola]|uniref:Flagellar protein n=1 Tax=Mixta theicola TaxID=1458355 RepID=A0A2K1Q817_9GAMM|nr:flagellar biosynthetic protein FliO [Mixta theicola]PNS11179.1 flagellar biosynthetic protein FliO [Mixta theicola]GLR07558.1 flagellar protein [Mixta theicola]
MNDASTTLSLVTQVSGALAIVVLLIISCAWLARRCGLAGHARAHGSSIAVKSSYSLGQRERLVVVEVDGQRLLLGVTPGAITRLGRLSQSAEAQTVATPDFQLTLKRLLKRGKAEPEQ